MKLSLNSRIPVSQSNKKRYFQINESSKEKPTNKDFMTKKNDDKHCVRESSQLNLIWNRNEILKRMFLIG